MNINLATRIYLNTRRVSIVLTVITLLVLGGLSWVLWNTISDYQEIRSLRAMMARQSLSAGGKSVSEVEYQRVMGRVSLINSFLAARSTEWLVLLGSLEKVLPDGVMLTEISPEQKGGYRISGHAIDFRRVRQLFERLSAGDLFTDVFLVSQGRLKVSDTQQGVTFTLTAKVKP